MLEPGILLNLVAYGSYQIFTKYWQHFLPKCPLSTTYCASQLTVDICGCKVSNVMSHSRGVQCWHFKVAISAKY